MTRTKVVEIPAPPAYPDEWDEDCPVLGKGDWTLGSLVTARGEAIDCERTRNAARRRYLACLSEGGEACLDEVRR